jgi:hypothetical protein
MKKTFPRGLFFWRLRKMKAERLRDAPVNWEYVKALIKVNEVLRQALEDRIKELKKGGRN